jgi:hypothetical protein
MCAGRNGRAVGSVLAMVPALEGMDRERHVTKHLYKSYTCHGEHVGHDSNCFNRVKVDGRALYGF